MIFLSKAKLLIAAGGFVVGVLTTLITEKSAKLLKTRSKAKRANSGADPEGHFKN